MRVCEEEKYFAQSKLLIQLLNTPKLKQRKILQKKTGKRNEKLEIRKEKKEIRKKNQKKYIAFNYDLILRYFSGKLEGLIN
jgi:hypothetical protein